MRLQTLAIGQFNCNLAQCLCPYFTDFNDAAALLKVINPQWAGKPGSAAGGQYVIRPSAIVAQAFTGVGAQKNRTRVD